jgi:hypothetical protein
MILKYSLDENHYLIHQLYTASKSERITKKRFRNKIIVPLFYVFFGILFFVKGNTALALIFGVFAILWYFLYPKWERRKYANHFNAYIKENFTEKLNQVVTVELADDFIHTMDAGSESKVSTSEIVELIEISSMFLIKIKGGQSLIIPKEDTNHTESIKLRLLEMSKLLNIPYSEELNWEWK